MAKADLDAQLTELDQMSSAQLRQRWISLTKLPLPKVSPSMLRLALAWEIQARELGGIPRQLRQRLDQLAGGRSKTRTAVPGMQLMREWNGAIHVVTIKPDGVVRWKDKDWRSLSEVAREITGTRWSGPAFFGLRKAA